MTENRQEPLRLGYRIERDDTAEPTLIHFVSDLDRIGVLVPLPIPGGIAWFDPARAPGPARVTVFDPDDATEGVRSLLGDDAARALDGPGSTAPVVAEPNDTAALAWRLAMVDQLAAVHPLATDDSLWAAESALFASKLDVLGQGQHVQEDLETAAGALVELHDNLSADVSPLARATIEFAASALAPSHPRHADLQGIVEALANPDVGEEILEAEQVPLARGPSGWVARPRHDRPELTFTAIWDQIPHRSVDLCDDAGHLVRPDLQGTRIELRIPVHRGLQAPGGPPPAISLVWARLVDDQNRVVHVVPLTLDPAGAAYTGFADLSVPLTEIAVVDLADQATRPVKSKVERRLAEAQRHLFWALLYARVARLQAQPDAPLVAGLPDAGPLAASRFRRAAESLERAGDQEGAARLRALEHRIVETAEAAGSRVDALGADYGFGHFAGDPVTTGPLYLAELVALATDPEFLDAVDGEAA